MRFVRRLERESLKHASNSGVSGRLSPERIPLLFLYAYQVVPALLLEMRDVVVCLITAFRMAAFASG